MTQQELITKSLYHSVVFFHKLQNQIENNISSLPNTLIDPTLSKINDKYKKFQCFENIIFLCRERFDFFPLLDLEKVCVQNRHKNYRVDFFDI